MKIINDLKVQSYSSFEDQKKLKLKETITIIVYTQQLNNASFVGSSYQYILNSKIGNLYVDYGMIQTMYLNVGEEVFLSIDEKDIKILK